MKASARQLAIPTDLETELHDLMRRSFEGDQRAYATMLERISAVLRAYLKKSVNSSRVSREQVEDLVQDVLMAVHQKRDSYRMDLPVLPWLFTIARYRLIDSYRAEGRKLISVSFEDELDGAEFPAPSNYDDIANKNDLEVMMGSLSEKQRTALYLAKVEELPLADVSQKMNMSLSAVKVTIHRALQALRKNEKAEKREDG